MVVRGREKTRGGLSVSPWHLFAESTPRPRPFPARLHRGESQQNGGAGANHVTSLCFPPPICGKQTRATRLDERIKHRGGSGVRPAPEPSSENRVFIEIRRVRETGRHGGHFAQACAGTIAAPLDVKTPNESATGRAEMIKKINKNIPIPPLSPSPSASAALPG